MGMNVRLSHQKDVSKYYTSFDVPHTATLLINNSKFICNSIVLALNSDIFENRIYSGEEEFVIHLPISQNAEKFMHEFLLYLHGRTMSLTRSNIFNSCFFASTFKVNEFVEHCFCFISFFLEDNPVKGILKLFPIINYVTGDFKDKLLLLYTDHIKTFEERLVCSMIDEIKQNGLTNMDEDMLAVLIKHSNSISCGEFLMLLWNKSSNNFGRNLILKNLDKIQFGTIFDDINSLKFFIQTISDSFNSISDENVYGQQLIQIQNHYVKQQSTKYTQNNIVQTKSSIKSSVMKGLESKGVREKCANSSSSIVKERLSDFKQEPVVNNAVAKNTTLTLRNQHSVKQTVKETKIKDSTTSKCVRKSDEDKTVTFQSESKVNSTMEQKPSTEKFSKATNHKKSKTTATTKLTAVNKSKNNIISSATKEVAAKCKNMEQKRTSMSMKILAQTLVSDYKDTSVQSTSTALKYPTATCTEAVSSDQMSTSKNPSRTRKSKKQTVKQTTIKDSTTTMRKSDEDKTATFQSESKVNSTMEQKPSTEKFSKSTDHTKSQTTTTKITAVNKLSTNNIITSTTNDVPAKCKNMEQKTTSTSIKIPAQMLVSGSKDTSVQSTSTALKYPTATCTEAVPSDQMNTSKKPSRNCRSKNNVTSKISEFHEVVEAFQSYNLSHYCYINSVLFWLTINKNNDIINSDNVKKFIMSFIYNWDMPSKSFLGDLCTFLHFKWPTVIEEKYFDNIIQKESPKTFIVSSEINKEDMLFSLEKNGHIVVHNVPEKCQVAKSICTINDHRLPKKYFIRYTNLKWKIVSCKNLNENVHSNLILNIYIIGPTDNTIDCFIPLLNISKKQLISQIDKNKSCKSYVLKIIYAKEPAENMDKIGGLNQGLFDQHKLNLC